MTMANRAYVVRDDTTTGPAGAGEGSSSGPARAERLYPYTLKGLTEALEEARYRSFAGPPQLVTVVAEVGSKVIRRYQNGHEVP